MWRQIITGKKVGTARRFELLVWCSEDEFVEYQLAYSDTKPGGSTWSMIWKSRDDGPLFYYPDLEEYIWFFNGERMPFKEWFACISLNLGNGPRRDEEEQAMLLLQYA